jgi:hypothetical protein
MHTTVIAPSAFDFACFAEPEGTAAFAPPAAPVAGAWPAVAFFDGVVVGVAGPPVATVVFAGPAVAVGFAAVALEAPFAPALALALAFGSATGGAVGAPAVALDGAFPEVGAEVARLKSVRAAPNGPFV